PLSGARTRASPGRALLGRAATRQSRWAAVPGGCTGLRQSLRGRGTLPGWHPALARHRPRDAGNAARHAANHSAGRVPSEPDLVRSGDQFLDDMAVNVGEAEVAASIAIRQLLVIETEQVENRRVQVVDVDLVPHRSEAELVGGAVDVAALHPAACQPHAESVMV